MARLLSAANIASVAGIFGIFCCYVDAFRPLSEDRQPRVKRSEVAAKIAEDERKVRELLRQAMIMKGIHDSFKKERKFYLERKRVLRCQLDALENEKKGK